MKKIVKITLLILWLGVIFFFSSQSGVDSGNLSSKLLLDIVTFLKFNNPVEFTLKYSAFFRKLAHFGEYFILGILMTINLEGYKKDNKRFILSVLLCILYATSDELHQLFIPGRVFSFNDVFIDSVGSITSIIFTTLIYQCCLEKKR